MAAHRLARGIRAALVRPGGLRPVGRHEVKFTDPPIADALAQVGEVLKNPKYVNAGFGDVADHRLDAVPRSGGQGPDGECTFCRFAATRDASSPPAPRSARTARWTRSTCRRSPTSSARRCSAAAPSTRRSRTVPRCRPSMWFAASPEYANARAQAGSYISSNRGLQDESVSTPILATALETLQAGGHDVPVRRLGPDAGSGRFGRGVEGVHRVDHRPGRRHDAGQHRRGVAGD